MAYFLNTKENQPLIFHQGSYVQLLKSMDTRKKHDIEKIEHKKLFKEFEKFKQLVSSAETTSQSLIKAELENSDEDIQVMILSKDKKENILSQIQTLNTADMRTLEMEKFFDCFGGVSGLLDCMQETYKHECRQLVIKYKANRGPQMTKRFEEVDVQFLQALDSTLKPKLDEIVTNYSKLVKKLANPKSKYNTKFWLETMDDFKDKLNRTSAKIEGGFYKKHQFWNESLANNLALRAAIDRSVAGFHNFFGW